MFFKEFFYFSKSDRKVILFLFLCFVVGLLLVRWMNRQPLSVDDTSGTEQVKTSSRGHQHREREYDLQELEAIKPTLQLSPFDPNTATAQQLLALGLQPWQVKNILKYRAKGGIYRQPSDFAKVYGLTRKHYLIIEPYIRISDDYRPAAELFAEVKEERTTRRDTLLQPFKISEGQQVMLNTADTTQLKKVPGIGSYFARQIVRYRERLGGFVDVNQLKEIDDFPTDALRFFALSPTDASSIQPLNLNQLTLNQLKRHPYIGFYRAKAIVDYRRLHGDLRSLADLKLIPEITDEWIARIQPYVVF